MAMNVYTQRWIANLVAAGAIKRGASILDLGPQDLYRYAPESEVEARMMGAQERPGDWYRSIGLGDGFAGDYVSVDRDDKRATWHVDLNEPWHHGRRFDVVHNGGTLEHVFNIGQAFKTIHEVLAPGGIALHVMPAAGDSTHGFFNINPNLYRDLAVANGYEPVSFEYVADIDAVCLRMIGEPVPEPRPLKDYICAALRKIHDAPFVWPQQECGYFRGGR